LQNELKGKPTRIVMVAFDLLYLNGYDLRKLPLTERKALLKKLIAKTDIQYSESFEGDGREIFAHACKIGLKASSPRLPTATTPPAGATTGSRRPAPSARR
jgi:bifunctional non-homologous end joining protein LigD